MSDRGARRQARRGTDVPAGIRRRRRLRTTLLAALAAVLLIAAVGAGVAWSMLYRPATETPAGSPVQVEIAKGSSTAEIGAKLASLGVVANANMFRLRSRVTGADGDLKAGVYDLVTGMSYDGAIEALRSGPVIRYVTVTIPEGFVVDQIAKRLEADANVPADEFLALAKRGAKEFESGHPYLKGVYGGSLEGYLFPKTYRIKEGSTARDVIEMMLAQFDKEIAAVDMGPAEKRGQSLEEIVTIASIIEREAQRAEERPLVSSVIYNRLDRGMKLEICATIEYVLPGNRFRLDNQDLKIESPYNTYKYAGLPPGPISNPGIASIKAAVAPAQTGYLYYVLTGKDGSHTFTTNYKDFEVAKQRSKEVFGQ